MPGLAVLLLLAAGAPALAAPGPSPRTETREPCAAMAPLRAPFFGELHVHTAVSADASFQVVQGWVDAAGATHERVFDVAGGAGAAGVDPTTCAPPPGAGEPFAACCLGPGTDAFLGPVVQERAWTSPLWSRPEADARLRAKLRRGARPGRDRLVLRLALGAMPRGLDPAHDGLALQVRADDDVLHVTLPPGALVRRGMRLVPARPVAGLDHVGLALAARGTTPWRRPAGGWAAPPATSSSAATSCG